MNHYTDEQLTALEAVKPGTELPWYQRATDDARFQNARYISDRPGPEPSDKLIHDNQRGMDPTAAACHPTHVIAITCLQYPFLATADGDEDDDNLSYLVTAANEYPTLVQELRETREALEWYGDKANWENKRRETPLGKYYILDSEAGIDKGARARTARESPEAATP